MSLLRWKELAQRKAKLGHKINYVHDQITKHDIGEKTSQASFTKVFNPITTKLDEVIDSNIDLKLPRKKRPIKRGEVPDYGIKVDDEVEDMGLYDLFDEQPVLPDSDKQLVPKPPTYEQSLYDLLDGDKEIYVDPQFIPKDPEDLPPEYADDEEIDYSMADEDITKGVLNDLGLANYESVEKILNQPSMTPKKTKAYLNKITNYASFERNRLKGYKANITKKYNRGEISEAQRQLMNKRLDNARAVLNEYIQHYKDKMDTIKGSGFRGPKKIT